MPGFSGKIWFKVCLVAALLLPLGACDDYPKDARGALKKIHQQGVLDVGVVQNAPWVEVEDGQLSGIEVEIIRGFADSLGVRPDWHFLSPELAMTLVGDGHLDIVIGGFSARTQGTWAKEASFTRPYLTARPAEPRENPAKPAPLFARTTSEALPRVIALTKGENALLVALERYLTAHKGEIADILAREEEQK